MDKTQMRAQVERVARARLADKHEPETSAGIERECRMIAALDEAGQIFDNCTQADLARLLVDGIKPMDYEEWLTIFAEVEGDNPAEALKRLAELEKL